MHIKTLFGIGGREILKTEPLLYDKTKLKKIKQKQYTITLGVRKTGSKARLSRFATQLSHLLTSCMTSNRSLKSLCTLVSSSATWK